MLFLIFLRLSSDTKKIRGLSFVLCAQKRVLPRIHKLKELSLHLLTNKFDVDFVTRVGGWVGRERIEFGNMDLCEIPFTPDW